jgi:predicted Rossmann fold flavoprotein
MQADVVVIGAGASGLMCAMEAGKRGRSVLVLEHTERTGSKIRISGGGLCNFTNRNVSRENYISTNPHFTTSALSRFTPGDFISLIEKHKIKYHEREGGQLFCNESAQEIIDMLQAECQKASVKFVMRCKISKVEKAERFFVATNRGVFETGSLVIATGGLAAPKVGATNFGYLTAKQFGLKVTPLKPALTPLLFSPKDQEIFGSLSGISMKAAVSYGAKEFMGSVLFTHKGLSGPAILQISSYWDERGNITLDLLPGIDTHTMLLEKRGSRMLLGTLLDQHLPARFAKKWCDLHFESKPLNQYSPRELHAVAAALHHWRIRPARTDGFSKAEVTLGGVDTNELSSKTMESKKVQGLYFLGEVVDVTGQLGGYNLHWAWASGYAAGQYV